MAQYPARLGSPRPMCLVYDEANKIHLCLSVARAAQSTTTVAMNGLDEHPLLLVVGASPAANRNLLQRLIAQTASAGGAHPFVTAVSPKSAARDLTRCLAALQHQYRLILLSKVQVPASRRPSTGY